MPRFPKPPEGSWTEHYPELGTAPVAYDDSISPEFHELERDAIFRRAWLNVGRVEQLPKSGSYFTRELVAANASVIVVRGADGTVRVFHNVCRHRGNKLVWDDHPREETRGFVRQFVCKYHGWRYDTDGALTHVQQEDEFFDLDPTCYGLVPVHCDVWAGFVFVSFAKEPEQSLREFLGPMITDLEGYPFDRMTERFGYRTEVRANWKLFMDVFAEFYHAPVLHAKQSRERYAIAGERLGFEAPYYRIDGPHRLVSTAGVRNWEMGEDAVKPSETLTRGGLFGPWDPPDLGEMPSGVNPGRCSPWGLDSFQIFPNFVILIWSQGWYLTYHYWPTSYQSHVFEGNVYFLPATTARERIAHEMTAVTFKEFALQDGNTLEATQLALETRAVDHFHLNDQEILLRHLHRVVGDWVDDHRAGRGVGGVSGASTMGPESGSAGSASGVGRMLPEAFDDLERFAPRWCLATESERYAARLASTMDELQELYDAVLPRVVAAIDHCDAHPLDDMPEDVVNLMRLVYSFVIVAFPIEVWRSPRVPDSGSVELPCIVEPQP